MIQTITIFPKDETKFNLYLILTYHSTYTSNYCNITNDPNPTIKNIVNNYPIPF